MTNLFAFRATEPKRLLERKRNPVGTDNDFWLKQCANESDLVVAAWGNLGKHRNRSELVKGFFPTLHCLKINGSGEPAHPLYIPKTARAILLQPS